jgi:hypothetical protein
MKKLFILPILFFTTLFTQAQEFNCSVSVLAPQIQTSDRKVFETLQTALYEFMNTRKWTNYTFKVEEKIECSFTLTINERPAIDEFKGTLNIQLRRPAYKTSYNSVLLNYIDKDIQFKYIEFQPLDFAENTFTNNLTSVFAYYAYVCLGFDFDSFSPNGGTPFFEKAQSVVNQAQNVSEKGWKSVESNKNRYWLIENLINSAYSQIRQANYKYHRLGLDQMYENVDKGRLSISDALELLQKAYREKPGLLSVQLFIDAKSDELVNIYSKASPQEKAKIINVLSEIDPANVGKYQNILNVN